MERIGLSPGSEVGGYRILAPLGSGGMGAVYRAADGGGVEVALKLLHPHIGADPAARERLRREVSALQRLRHPAVAAVLDAEADSSEAFIVTELVDGENLTDHVRAHGPLGGEELLDLARGLRGALEAVHDAGVIHRDLKPSNVVLTREGPVLIDFGIAQGMDDSRLTSTGIVLGTPGYLAPELLDGAEPDESSDWWGWAAVLAFAATGREPFGSRPVEAVLARARSGEVDLDGVGLLADPLRSALEPRAAHRAPPDSVVASLENIVAGGGRAGTDTGATTVLPGPGADSGATTVLPGGRADLGVAGLAAGTGAGADPGATAVLSGSGADSGGGARAGAGTDAGVSPNDGHTRAWETDHDDGGFTPLERGDDTFGYEGLTDDEEHAYTPPTPPRRTGTLLALLVVAVATAALAPGVVAITIGALTLLFGTVQSAASALEARRERRGLRRGDALRTAVSWPWHLLRGSVIAIPSLLVAASVVIVVGGIAWWLLDTQRLVVPTALGGVGTAPNGNEPWVYLSVIAVAMLAGLATLWGGPFSRHTRLGARRTLERIAPGRTGAMVLIAAALVGLAIVTVLLATGQPTWWWPLPGPPSLA